MKSMTGYGRGTASRQDYHVSVEASSVNRKQAEVMVGLPRELDSLEPEIRKLALGMIRRGRATLKITLASNGSSSLTRMRVNVPLAREYATELTRLHEVLGLAEPVDLGHLLNLPGVLEPVSLVADPQAIWPVVRVAVKRALDELVGMRVREGDHLAAELQHRIQIMQKALQRISRRAPKVSERYRRQLRRRVEQAGVPAARQDEDRLCQEVVLFCDRADISEELSRMQSHIQQFEHYRQSRRPIGRTLDFLAQEMNREINTIGSKANDARIARDIITLKTELEKFREQAQNVE